jgi:hypothetical protein
MGGLERWTEWVRGAARCRLIPGLGLLVLGGLGCGGDDPPLPPPGSSGAADPATAVTGPDTPGLSQEFEDMEVPPGQLTRAIPVGDAWAEPEGPAYRSLCLRCHSVSQTSFAVTDWLESAHAKAGVLCGSCHGTHEEGFITKPGVDRCIVCHAPQVEEFLASGHGPERAPGMRCISCHEAHATDRGLIGSVALCTGCHLDSEHVQGFPASRMGTVLAEHPVGPDGDIRAPDCVFCHMPESPILRETGDYRRDRVTLHDSAITVGRHPKDPRRLTDETIEFLVPLCVQCHSERNARYRLENSDPLIRRWTPIGMAGEIRRRPAPDAGPDAGAASSPGGGS